MAEPALDVGLFRAAIKDTGMNISFSSAFYDQFERLARPALLILDHHLQNCEKNHRLEQPLP